VVDVGLVGMEWMSLSADASQHHTDDIQTGNQQDAECHDNGGTVGLQCLGTEEHAVLDDQEAQDETERQAAGVAHENLPAPLGVAEEVIEEEGYQRTHTDECHLGVEPHFIHGKNNTEHTECHDADAGSQTIDAVDEVDGIGDEYYQ